MGTTLITQDLLEYASSLPAGFYSISTVGGTPNAIGVAATGYILRRTGVDAIVALYGISSGTLNVNHYDGHTWLGWLKYTTNTDLRFYSTTNGITKIASLPWGIYNLQDSEVRALTDKPSELNQGRAIIITSGLSTNDEKVALILASSGRDGGVYFGYVWGSNTPEFSWKKIIGNNA